jgi:ElaB/YqjD/DUF883 family membrane-anchored ribosome-binding protein
VNGSLPLVSVALLALAAPCLAQDAQRQVVEQHWREGRLDLAYEALGAIEDPGARSDWEFQVLYAAGDLPGAFAAASAGVETAPDHLGLLQSATYCAVTLGLAEQSEGLLERWGKALERSGEPLARIESSARAREQMAGQVRELVEREREAVAAVARAKWTAITILAAAGIALATLAFVTRSPKPTDASR